MTPRKMLGFAAVVLATTVLTGFALDAVIGTSKASGPAGQEEQWVPEWDGTYWKCYVHIEEGAHVEDTNICSDGSTAGGASDGDDGDGAQGDDGATVVQESYADAQDSENASCTMDAAAASDDSIAQQGDNSSSSASANSDTDSDAKQKCNNQEIEDSYNQDNDVTGSYNQDNDVTNETSSCSMETNESEIENTTYPERDGPGTTSSGPNGYGGGNVQECNNEDNDSYSAECSANAQLIALNNCQGRTEPDEPRNGGPYETVEKEPEGFGLLGLL